MMALTATALRRQVMKTLGMRNAAVISVPPNKNNITYIVRKFEILEISFGALAEELKEGSTDLLSNNK